MKRAINLLSEKAWAKGRETPQIDTRYGHSCKCGEQRKPSFSWFEPTRPRLTTLNISMGYIHPLPESIWQEQTPTIQRVVQEKDILRGEEINQRIWGEYMVRVHALASIEKSKYGEALEAQEKSWED